MDVRQEAVARVLAGQARVVMADVASPVGVASVVDVENSTSTLGSTTPPTAVTLVIHAATSMANLVANVEVCLRESRVYGVTAVRMDAALGVEPVIAEPVDVMEVAAGAATVVVEQITTMVKCSTTNITKVQS